MGPMPRPTDDLKDAFRALVPPAEGVTVKPMFGNLAGFVNGNMFCGLFGEKLFVRVGGDDRDRLPFVVDFGGRQQLMGGHEHLADRLDRQQLLELRHVGGGQGRHDPRQGAHRGQIDPHDPRVGVRAPRRPGWPSSR